MKNLYAVAACVLLSVAGTAASADIVLGDGNSVARINETGAGSDRPGMYAWEIDGVDQLFEQWFYFRAAGDTQERALHTLPLTGQFATDTNPFEDVRADTVALRYGGSGFNITTSWTLRGGSTGTGVSDIAETISIVNTSRTARLAMSFFQYSDYDLNGTSQDASIQVVGLNNTVQQVDGVYGMNETVITPRPSHFEVGSYPSVLNKLTDGDIDNLADFAGPIVNSDLSWGFQWNLDLAPGETYIISKDRHMVPAPGAAALAGLGGLMMVRRRRGG